MTAPALSGVFTIPAGGGFLDDLAAGLAAVYPPEVLATAKVYLPTRRACRDLTEAFLALPGDAGLLPTAYPLGDVDADDLIFMALEPALGDLEATLDLAPAVSPLRRTLMLARLAQAKHAAEQAAAGEPGALPLAAAVRLAAALGRFLDELAIERADVAAIEAIDAGRYAEHWRRVLTFLEVVLTHWPAMLAAEGRQDPTARREALLKAQAAAWRAAPPTAPVIIAGSTGALASTRELMAAVLAAPAGAVVLPGFDAEVEKEELTAILAAPSHPQHAMAFALDDLGVATADVAMWPAADPTRGAARRNFVDEALRPAARVAAWGGLADGAFEDARAGLLRVDAPNEDAEARVIALYLRAHATETARLACVTPDRNLARRVAAELRRWDIEADDSAGRPLGETAVGAYLSLIARAFRPGAGAVDFLALLKHPLAAGGMARPRFRRRARALEAEVWREEKAQPHGRSFEAISAYLAAENRPLLAAFADTVAEAATPLTALNDAGPTDLATLLTAHIHVAETLAASHRETGAERLWRGADGEAAADLLADALDAADASPGLTTLDYADAFDALLSDVAVRPRRAAAPQVAILGVLEARLSRFDAVALGGLDEGVWPRPPAADPWFSRAMRSEIGLSDPDRRTGLSAHDFAQHLATENVLLTRSRRRDGAPTKPSRWLARLDAALAAAGGKSLTDGGERYLDMAGRLDPTLPTPEEQELAPRPPVAARPRTLSVTAVKTLRDDPYQTYARFILGLRPLAQLDPPPSPADRGKIVHAAFESFLRAWPNDLPADIAAELEAAGAEAFKRYMADPAIAAFWRPAFSRAARWAAAAERARRAELGVAEVHAELDGRAAFAAPAGPFYVQARADRVDRLISGDVAIVDIKTGAPPSKRALEQADEPQLPLEAAIARHGAFGDLAGRSTAELAIWRMGGQSDGLAVAIDGAKVAAAADTAWEGAQRLIAGFDDEETPYLSEPRGPVGYSDYRALARQSEDVE